MRRKNPKVISRKSKAEKQKAIEPVPETEPALVSLRESAAQIREILDQLFDGNAEAIVESLADSGELTPEEMARMKEVFRKSKGSKKK